MVSSHRDRPDTRPLDALKTFSDSIIEVSIA